MNKQVPHVLQWAFTNIHIQYLYCCLVSHLPALVSRSLVAKTRMMLRNNTKLTCRKGSKSRHIMQALEILVIGIIISFGNSTGVGDRVISHSVGFNSLYSPPRPSGWALDISISNCPHLNPNTCTTQIEGKVGLSHMCLSLKLLVISLMITFTKGYGLLRAHLPLACLLNGSEASRNGKTCGVNWISHNGHLNQLCDYCILMNDFWVPRIYTNKANSLFFSRYLTNYIVTCC